jgi:hypothetical protein
VIRAALVTADWRAAGSRCKVYVMGRMDRTIRGVVLLCSLVPVALSPAHAGVLRGQLALAESHGRDRHLDDAVVWLEAIPDDVEHRLATGGFRWFWQAPRQEPVALLRERARHFEPHVTVLPVLAPLEIRNDDDVWHGAFSVTPEHRFELGKRAPGSTDTLRFDAPGVISVRCDIHPDMAAYIAVTPNHAFARASETGGWQFPDVPAGVYTLHAWHPDRGETKLPVHVPTRGDTLVNVRW